LLCKPGIALQVEKNALENMGQVIQAIAALFQDFDLVVQAFDKAAICMQGKEAGDLYSPIEQSFQQIVEASQATLFTPLDPSMGFDFCHGLRNWLVEDIRQLLLELVSQLQDRRIYKQSSQDLAIFRVPVLTLSAERPHTAFQLLVSFIIQFLFQALEFLLTQIIDCTTVLDCHVKTIDKNLSLLDFLAYCFGEAFEHVAADGMDRVQLSHWDRT